MGQSNARKGRQVEPGLGPGGGKARERALLHGALVFAIVAVVAAVRGFGGVAEGAAEAARVLFYIFLGLVVVFAVLDAGLYRRFT